MFYVGLFFADRCAMLEAGFNVRVYGALFSPKKDKLLFVEEVVMGKALCKFPGGGVEFSEAPGNALVREFKEELGVEVELGGQLYVSPAFHQSFFRPQQLIGLYWHVNLKNGEAKALQPNAKLHWVDWQNMDLAWLTHDLDREVVRYLRQTGLRC